MRRRLDAELVRRGLAPSRHQAAELIDRGVVLVGGSVADKPARMVTEGEAVAVDSATPRFVSRGGDKLDAALGRFAVDVRHKRCLDAGASTGGFTDCLLRRGAAHVVAVDVCKGFLDSRLRDDARVTLLERTNVRHLTLDIAGGIPFDVVVCDLSFISLTAVAEALAARLPVPDADLVLLVKPQFEVGRVVASRGRGVVRDTALRRAALESAAVALESAGASIIDAMPSPLLGPAGNAEYFLHAKALTHTDTDLRTHTHADAASEREARLAAMLEAAVADSPDRRGAGSPDPKGGG